MKVDTIEIIINGTEKVKQDWGSHEIDVNEGDAHWAMNDYATDLGNRLAKLGTSKHD